MGACSFQIPTLLIWDQTSCLSEIVDPKQNQFMPCFSQPWGYTVVMPATCLVQLRDGAHRIVQAWPPFLIQIAKQEEWNLWWQCSSLTTSPSQYSPLKQIVHSPSSPILYGILRRPTLSCSWSHFCRFAYVRVLLYLCSYKYVCIFPEVCICSHVHSYDFIYFRMHISIFRMHIRIY